MNNFNAIKPMLMKTNIIMNNNYSMTDHGKYLLDMADQYHIPYDVNNIDWYNLIALVNNYIMLVEKMTFLGISFDYDYYDPVALEQEIEEYERSAAIERNKNYYESYQDKLA